MIAQVVDAPLSVAEHEDAVADKAAGAVVSFAGVVRDHDGGRSVTELEYVGHPTAAGRDRASWPRSSPPAPTCTPSPSRTGSACSASATSRWPARSAPSHRGQAFAACAELVDEVKKRLPIWKRQVFTDGEEEWVACP